MAEQLRLSANLNSFVDFLETDQNNVRTHTDDAEEAVYEFTYDTGNAYYVDDGFYFEKTLSAGQTQLLSFQNLPRKVLNRSLTRSWDIVKAICVENTSISGVLFIGDSGAANPVGLGYANEIGASGVYKFSSPIGLSIDNNHRNVQIINQESFSIRFRFWAIGVKS